ncbi:MAG: cytochrome ubiquinol oxidase subunit I [Bacteroidota bacterium]|nr:cytochrome ubiquinol oxidase subunit I [Bacteroidota bacterium]
MGLILVASVVSLSRAQFALTAMYHWLFVPLTLGLSFIIAIMESLYVKTGNEEWKRITKFWMTLFGINFAIGIATGIILEFEFGTNWSNYSWFVGDIFGAPLAIEGILAFFMESTFVAVMFFGWTKVSKGFHLLSTWLVFVGSNLSALWILVANAWMQNPVGMRFNPDTARNEMVNFWEMLSPVAINKFFHTLTSGYVLAAVFVCGISAWFLIRRREQFLAIKSITVACIFGLISSVLLAISGDSSARLIAHTQPMKLAAMEGVYHGNEGQSLMAIGILVKSEQKNLKNEYHVVKYRIEIPHLLSFLAFGKFNAFVPGVDDLIQGNHQYGLISAKEKIARGKTARNTLMRLYQARKSHDTATYNNLKEKFHERNFVDNQFRYFGYGFLNDTNSLIPNVPLVFYSFHIMVVLGFFFILLFLLLLLFIRKKSLEIHRFWLWISLWSMPLAYIASQSGWVVSEVGRQPWVVQDLMPAVAAISQIDASAVETTFILFAVLFTALLIAEFSIMIKQIRLGSKKEK